MGAVVAVGMQYGDEGKGKVCDYLANEASIAVRFNGGNNAGHSVVANGKRHAVHLLPSPAYRLGMKLVIAAGVVFDPAVLIAEIKDVWDETGVKPDLIVSEKCHLIGRRHRKRDAEMEEARKDTGTEIGTTRRGNGPVYADKMLRSGDRAMDLLGMSDDRLGIEYNLNQDGVAFLSQFLGDDVQFLDAAFFGDHFLLYCGAHGALLDIDHGTYPYVTSSNCIAGSACTGGGLPPKHVGQVVGITKAYMTRIGTGPFPSEIEDEHTASYIRETGKEYGTTTGRPRRIGWLDFDALEYVNMINGCSYLALTMLDVLTASPIFVMRDGKLTQVDGWIDDISGCTKWEELPSEAQSYVQMIENYIRVPVRLVSVGPDRKQIIDRRADGSH